MNSYKRDYNKLYRLQDNFLAWWKTLEMPFYLTGGTALGRFYLHHRFSEDLDFFVNSSSEYQFSIEEISRKLALAFNIDKEHSLFSKDFTRLFISAEDTFLKIEFVNDVEYLAEPPIPYDFGKIDKPLNILANKLTAVVGRDEPKDIFDIVHIARNYSFNWLDVFNHAKQKAIVNEIDIELRLHTFPIDFFKSTDWLINPLDLTAISESLMQIADDFLLGTDNSLGKDKIPIESAVPLKGEF